MRPHAHVVRAEAPVEARQALVRVRVRVRVKARVRVRVRVRVKVRLRARARLTSDRQIAAALSSAEAYSSGRV